MTTTDPGKATDGFWWRGTSLEPMTPDLGTTMTPVDDFFICTVDNAPELDTDQWRLRVYGDGADGDAELTLADLKDLPMVEQTVWLECAGNGRTLYELVAGNEIERSNANTMWMLNGMGIGSWRGPTLRSVLEMVGIAADAAFVTPMGLDIDNAEGEPPRMCLPLDKALDDATIVALEMNGRPLPRAHGAPARLIVPGWVGAYSVKWIGELQVTRAWVPSWRADYYYVHREPDGTVTGPITSHPVKSSLALPWPAELARGSHEIHGYARSGQGAITSIEWKLDDGKWQSATFDPPEEPYAWTCFRFEVDLDAGEHHICSRATDSTGTAQPDSQPFHPMGVLWKSVIPHPVVVT